jgi:hypothetical protein
VRPEWRQLLEHQRGESLDVHAEERRSRSDGSRARDGEERGRLGSGRVGTDRSRRGGGAAACPDGVPDGHAVSPPGRLLIDGQQASPATVLRSTSDLVLRFHVSACGGRSIQGALVYATAVPFEQFNVPDEAVTGSDGWATLTFHKASRFPASSVQQLLTVFVRARKSGEDILGGISTRILVSFPVNLKG